MSRDSVELSKVPFSEEEVLVALYAISRDKALRLDGFIIAF